MEKSAMPFVAIVGGLWNITDANKRDEAKQAARIIGEELAKAGFGLVVYFSDDASLEPHVVSGYVPALAPDAGEIRVRCAQSQQDLIKFVEQGIGDKVFKRQIYPIDDWEAPFYGSLAAENGVDAVLLLSGAKSTLIAGQIATSRKLPILAVDTFGGSAQKIWTLLARAAPAGTYPSWRDQLPAQFVAQLKQECIVNENRRQALIQREQAIVQREQALANQRSQGRKLTYAITTFLILMIIVVFGMAYNTNPSAHPALTFAGLVGAGATGALIRALLGGAADISPRMSFLFGAVAGFVVGLAYLIPQWVGAPGVLEAKSTAVTATDKIQFASALLVAVSAGLGFDTVFSRLLEQAKGVAVAPPVRQGG